MGIFFSSDHHFFHKNVIRMCNRPFVNLDEMHHALILNHNSVVTDNDDVYFLGDLFFCGKDRMKEILRQLRGYKTWYEGNHDWKQAPNPKRAAEFGLQAIIRGRSAFYEGTRHLFDFGHFPYRNINYEEERYAKERPLDCGNWLVHGHVHNAWKVKDRMINIGVDVWDFTPVNINQILEIINGQQPAANSGSEVSGTTLEARREEPVDTPDEKR